MVGTKLPAFKKSSQGEKKGWSTFPLQFSFEIRNNMTARKKKSIGGNVEQVEKSLYKDFM